MDAISDSTIRFEESADGQLTLLALGEAVAASGLLGDFFKLMEGHDAVDSQTLVDLLAGRQTRP